MGVGTVEGVHAALPDSVVADRGERGGSAPDAAAPPAARAGAAASAAVASSPPGSTTTMGAVASAAARGAPVSASKSDATSQLHSGQRELPRLSHRRMHDR